MNKQNNQTSKRKFIVLDIVFYGSSLNYDQGSGNYQELKKITRWDGKVHTLVSRYALRYSLLKTGEELKLWELAPGNTLRRSGENETVIQPSIDILLSGGILAYPEYDFFGYLITDTTPQNSREAPVKISHAVSMTPYNYDAQFAGNLGLARRMVEAGTAEKMDPNIFTVEEHQTYYIYTVIIDVDRIGKGDVYIAKKNSLPLELFQNKENPREKEKIDEIIGISKEHGKVIIKAKKDGNEHTKEFPLSENIDVDVDKELEKVFRISFSFKESLERIVKLIDAILNLTRNIKGRKEFLHPKLLICGCYEGCYKSFKDRISLSNEYEEIYEELKEPNEDGKVKIIRRIIKLNKPVFVIKGITKKECKETDNKENIKDFVKKFLGIQEKESNNQEKGENKNKNQTEILIFKTPEIEVKYDKE